MGRSLKEILGKILKRFAPVLLCVVCVLGAICNADAQMLLPENDSSARFDYTKSLYKERDKQDKREQYTKENISKTLPSRKQEKRDNFVEIDNTTYAPEKTLAQVLAEADDYAGIDPKGEQIASTGSEAKATECPLVADVKAKHYAGCWACLVIEKMTSTFLYAANKGLKVSQKAGLVLLIVGSGIWLVVWGLKNVSSFTEVQIGNILNDLIKFLFKVAIAYWFIFYSQTAISKYFINPIMSVGALVGQQFWDAKIQQYTEDWSDDAEPVEDLAEEFEETLKKNMEEKKEQASNLAGSTESNVQEVPMTNEQKELLTEAKSLEMHENEKSDIPSFHIPGVTGGSISGYPGCRVRPNIPCKKGTPVFPDGKCYGSAAHMGLDVGGRNTQRGSIDMNPVWAITGGTVAFGGNESTGWGLYATITTNHKGQKWTHKYAHLNPKTYYSFKKQLAGKTVARDQQIGNIGTTGNSTGAHLHLEVQLEGKVGGYNYNGVYLDPISLGQGNIVPRNYRYDEGSKTFSRGNTCESQGWRGRNEAAPKTGYAKGAVIPAEGFWSNGKAGLDLSDTYVYEGSEYGGTGGNYNGGSFAGDYSTLIVSVPEVKYSGPTNIMSKSVMNSILGATRAITNTTAGVEVLGDVIMCYAGMENGGAWQDGILHKYWLNVPMWVAGAIILCLGYLLVMTIGYYLIDISFKIGFAVLAMPLVMGLWPFDMMKNKLFGIISIIAKAAATFAFLALTTAFGMALIDSTFDTGGLEELYKALDYLAQSDVDTSSTEFKEMRTYVSRELSFFSTKSILLCFSIWYFFKLIQSTSSDLVNKFFPDAIFGDSAPMHSGATMATAFAKKMAMKYTGANLVKDIAAHQTGRLIHGGLKKAGGAVRHPVNTAKSVGGAVKGAFNRLRGKGGAS